MAMSPLDELRQRLGLPAVAITPAPAGASDDEELLALGKELLSERDQNSPASATFLLEVRLPACLPAFRFPMLSFIYRIKPVEDMLCCKRVFMAFLLHLGCPCWSVCDRILPYRGQISLASVGQRESGLEKICATLPNCVGVRVVVPSDYRKLKLSDMLLLLLHLRR